MSRWLQLAALAAAALCCASLAVADSNVPVRILPGQSPWSIEFAGLYFNTSSETTSFKYRVTIVAAGADLGHLVVGAPNCGSVHPVGDAFAGFATDAASGVAGYRTVWGQGDGTTVVHVLELPGQVGASLSGSFGLVGGGFYDTGSITSPDCAAVHGFPHLDPQSPSPQVLPCGSSLPAPPSGLTQVGSHASAPLCAQEETTVVTYSASADVDGITYTTLVEYTYVTDDNTAPEFSIPADATVYCADVAVIQGYETDLTPVIANDDCGSDSIPVVPCINRTNTDCPQHYFIVRAYTATDECGNEECKTQTVTVKDDVSPVLLGDFEGGDYKCEDVLAMPALVAAPAVTAADACAGDLTGSIHQKFTTVSGECPNTYQIRRSWTVEDPCGNKARESQVINVFDNTAPHFVGVDDSVPRHRTVECEDYDEDEEITAYDDCAQQTYDVAYSQSQALEVCTDFCNTPITRNWSVCDECGNYNEIIRTLLVRDTTPPTFDLPAEADITVECDSVPAQREEPGSDLCDKSDLQANCVEERTNSSCENQYVLNRTCTVCDCCNLCTSRSRIITVVDSNITVPAAPASVTFQCQAIAPQEELVIPAQDCDDATVTQTYNESSSQPDAETCAYVITRNWYFVDCAENFNSVHQDYPVVDETAPVFDTCVDDEVDVFCNVPEPVTYTASDNCSDLVTVTSNDVEETEVCRGRGRVTRTYTADDNCGNLATCSIVFNKDDTIAPEWVTFPADASYSCEETYTVDTPTAFDNCSTGSVVPVSDVRVNSSACDNAYTRTITWKTRDSCGNESPPRSVVITVYDNTPPVLAEPLPQSRDEECDDISCPDTVSASDNCDDIVIDFVQTRVTVASPSCDNLYEIHRRWLARDQCGNADTHTQVITVFDNTPPTYTGSDNGTIELPCEERDTYVPPSGPERDWSDNCGDVIFVRLESPVTPTGECPQNVTKTFTWHVRDACGNTASVSKRVKFYDTEAPRIEQISSVTLECDDPLSAWPGAPEVEDDCSNTVQRTVNTSVNQDCTQTGYLTVYNITVYSRDQCHNEAAMSYLVKITDTTPPLMTCPPRELNGTCTFVPELVNLTASDNCDGSVNVIVGSEIRHDGACENNYTLERTWTATDHCGRTTECKQFVHVWDNVPPVLTGVPNTTISANCENVPKPEQTCATDNCSPLSIAFCEERLPGDCDQSYTLVRNWTAIDDCGNAHSASYNVVVRDTNPPFWTSALPEGSTAECVRGAPAPSFASPTCNDTCSTVSVTPNPTNEDGVCEGFDVIYHFSWVCDDGCGNTITHTTTSSVEDTLDPYFVWADGSAPAETASYDCEAPAAETATGEDQCTGTTVVNPPTDRTQALNYNFNASCPRQQSWTWVWTVSDECDHTVTHTQDVEVRRPGPPSFNVASLPDERRGCGSAEPSVPSVTATDACGVDITSRIVYTNVTNPTGCEGDETLTVRTWTVTDDCGQTISLTQNLYVEDRSPPTVVAPNPRQPRCDFYNGEAPTGAVAADDCDNDVYIEVNSTSEGACPVVITWYYYAYDNCGKVSVDTTVETYIFTDLPYVNSTHTRYELLECDVPFPEPDRVSWFDGCNSDLSSQGDVSYVNRTNGTCENKYSVDWVYVAVDDCGLTSTYVLTREVTDTTPPTIEFEFEPVDADVECPFVPPAPRATASDTCPGEVTLEFLEFKVGFNVSDCDCCTYDLYRVWEATDACGLKAHRTQRIRVRDTIPPVWNSTSNATEVHVECPEVAVIPTITFSEAPAGEGFCPGDSVATPCTEDDQGTASLTVDGVTYTLQPGARFVRLSNGFAYLIGDASPADAEDASLHVELQFNPGSPVNPLASAYGKDALLASCYGPDRVLPEQWHFYGELQGNLTNLLTDEKWDVIQTSNGQVGLGATGRNELLGARVEFATVPGAKPGLLSVDLSRCDTSGWNIPELLCGPPSFVTPTVDTNVICPGRFTTVYTWTASDRAGNTNSTQFTVYSDDTTIPFFTQLPSPAIATDDCDLPMVPDVFASDNCSSANVSGPVVTVISNDTNCPYRYELLRTWTAEDECGLLNYAEQTVIVNDNVDPTVTLSGVPNQRIYQCVADLPAVATATCTDNCHVAPTCEPQHTNADPANSCNQVITYAWTSEDACGNTDEDSYDVIVWDTTGPTCPAGVDCSTRVERASCDAVAPTFGDVSFDDNCDGTITVSPVVEGPTGSCPSVTTYSYSVVDGCGNAGPSFTITVQIYDEEDPVIVAPAARTVTSCDYNSPTAAEEIASGAVSASDNCDLDSLVHVADRKIYDGDCLIRVERDWLATDACGNDATATSIITVSDETAPVFTPSTVGDVTVQCNETVPCPPVVSVVDGCPSVQLSYTESTASGDCINERTITRTWTTTDACGNGNTLSYTVHVIDTLDPYWTTPEDERPQSLTVECGSVQSASAADMEATDGCGPASVSFAEVRRNTSGFETCNYYLDRTWTAVDDCENDIEYTVTIHVVDRLDPTFEEPTDKNHECDRSQQVPGFDPIVFDDECDDEVSVVPVDSTISEGCNGNYTLVRTWTGTDDCGNDAVADQNVVVRDTRPPVILNNFVALLTAECHEDPAESLVYGDDCSEQAEIDPDFNEVPQVDNPLICSHPYTVFRDWTVTDDCGHVATASQQVRVTDTEAPSISFDEYPESNSVPFQCNYVDEAPTATVTDECTGDITSRLVYVQGQPVGDACAWTVTRTWNADDCSGNDAEEVVQVLSFADTEAPVFGPFPDVGELDCVPGVELGIPDINFTDPVCGGATFGTRSVSPTLEFDFTDPNRECENDFLIIATWTASDDCGNVASTTNTYRFRDRTAPTYAELNDVTINCGEELPIEDLECSDNCDEGSSASNINNNTAVEIDDGDGCPTTKLYNQTYQCTDLCGNTVFAHRLIRVIDTVGPQWVNVPQPSRMYQCDETIPQEVPTAADNCGELVTASFVRDEIVEVPGACDHRYDVVRHWTVSDCSGNTNTTTQTYQVTDTTDPVLAGCPQTEISAECDNVPCPGSLTGTDNCDGLRLDYTEVRTNLSCEFHYDLLRTWTLVDACGNDDTCSQVIHVSDSTPPTFSGVLPANISTTDCTFVPPTQEALPYDEETCGTVTQTFWNETTTTDCKSVTYVFYWELNNTCGLTTRHVQEIQVIDEHPPVAPNNDCLCLDPHNTTNAYAEFVDFLVNGEFVTFTGDQCSDDSLTLSLLSCTSSQDAELGLVSSSGQTADCFIMGDILKIRLRASLLQEHGRLFDVAIEAKDGCGNSAVSHRFFWVPRDENSDLETGFPGLGAQVQDLGSCADSCITVVDPEVCPGCPCNYGVDECSPETNFVSSVHLDSHGYDSATNSTVFVYTVAVSAAIDLSPEGSFQFVTLGFDLAGNDITVSSVHAGVDASGPSLPFVLGFRPHSIVSGLTFTTADLFFPASSFTVAVVLHGAYGVSSNVAYHIPRADLTPSRCLSGTTEGPGPRTSAGLEAVCGSVGVYGTLLGGHQFADLRVPLSGVSVTLLVGGSPAGRTLSSADGSYCFYVRSGMSGLQVVLTPFKDGILGINDDSTLPAEQFSQLVEFLSADISVDAVYPWGEPQSVVIGVNNEFKLFINNVHLLEGSPDFYNVRSLLPGFRGTSRSIGFWTQQLVASRELADGSHCPRHSVLPIASIRAFTAYVDAKLSGCSLTGATAEARLLGALEAGGSLGKLAAVALNHASGHGPLEPYRSVQDLVLAYALRDLCPGPSQDALTESMLDELLATY